MPGARAAPQSNPQLADLPTTCSTQVALATVTSVTWAADVRGGKQDRNPALLAKQRGRSIHAEEQAKSAVNSAAWHDPRARQAKSSTAWPTISHCKKQFEHATTILDLVEPNPILLQPTHI